MKLTRMELEQIKDMVDDTTLRKVTVRVIRKYRSGTSCGK